MGIDDVRLIKNNLLDAVNLNKLTMMITRKMMMIKMVMMMICSYLEVLALQEVIQKRESLVLETGQAVVFCARRLDLLNVDVQSGALPERRLLRRVCGRDGDADQQNYQLRRHSHVFHYRHRETMVGRLSNSGFNSCAIESVA